MLKKHTHAAQKTTATSSPARIISQLQPKGFSSLQTAARESVSFSASQMSLFPPLQTKLTVGKPNSKYGQEANAVAPQVLNSINSLQPQQIGSGEAGAVERQRNSQEEAVQQKTLAESIQRQEVPEQEEVVPPKLLVQRKTEGEIAASPHVESNIAGARGGGQALDDGTRGPMEGAFGADFSGVRVHTDERSDQLNRSLQSRAFATGQDIFFKRGEFNPGSRGGQELLAHELTHVVQQSKGSLRSSKIQCQAGKADVKPSNLSNIKLSSDDINKIIKNSLKKINKNTIPSKTYKYLLDHPLKIGEKMIGVKDPSKPNDSFSTKIPRHSLSDLSVKVPDIKIKTSFNSFDIDDDKAVAESVENFQSNVLKKQIYSGYSSKVIASRIFLKGMRRYFGSYEKVIHHYQGVRPANVPGKPHLHSSAAMRLELVANKVRSLGSTMPSTTIALGLRGRHKGKKHRGKGRMAHPCGYAIDYRATTNPMITDRRIIKLLQMQVGKTNLDLGSYSSRRSKIKRIGKETASGKISKETAAKRDKMFSQIEKQLTNLQCFSIAFTQELPKTKKRILSYRHQVKELDNKIRRAKRRKKIKLRKKLKKEKIILDKKIKSEMPVLFSPWIKTTAHKSEALYARIASAFSSKSQFWKSMQNRVNNSKNRLSVSKKWKLEKNNVRREKHRISREIRKTQRALRRKTRRGSLQPGLKLSLKNNIVRCKRQLKVIPNILDWVQLQWLYQSLSGDVDFAFRGYDFKDPSAARLLEVGFFNFDSPFVSNALSNKGKRDGFNLLFIKTMMEHGFELGVSWGVGSVDPMHFELVEGVSSILSKKQFKKSNKS